MTWNDFRFGFLQVLVNPIFQFMAATFNYSFIRLIIADYHFVKHQFCEILYTVYGIQHT